ncbi:MAG: arylsulfatase, partial [Verrucomicrobiota bacterium]|nr:arylsulfatase [Verrucomicrobiota bacterium]
MKLLIIYIFTLLINISWAQMPNIILVITDDQGFGDFGFSGNQHIKTPHIDKFRNNSILLDNFHVDPTCSPTRAALLTGRYSNRTGVWHTVQGRNLLRKREITLPDILSNNGYKTGIFGKWHLGHNYPYRAQDRGFKHVVIHSAGGVGQAPDYWGNDYFDDTYIKNGIYEKFNGFCTDIWFDEAIKFIKENKNKPFFAYISTNAPHGPFYCPNNYTRLYENNPSVPNVPFYGMITNIDDNMGKLLSFLEDENLKNNTIIIYMTDNGTSAGIKWDNRKNKNIGYNFNMKGKKNSEYEGGHRVPFIISWPDANLAKVKTISKLTAHIDITPTLIDLCGLDNPDISFDGISLKELLTKPDTELPERTLIVESQRILTPLKWRKSAVMTDEWRLINGTELYNLKNDFEQKNDISKKYPIIVKKLRQAYEDYWDDVSKEHHIT